MSIDPSRIAPVRFASRRSTPGAIVAVRSWPEKSTPLQSAFTSSTHSRVKAVVDGGVVVVVGGVVVVVAIAVVVVGIAVVAVRLMVVVVGIVVGDSSEDSELPPHPASRAMHANAPISFFTP